MSTRLRLSVQMFAAAATDVSRPGRKKLHKTPPPEPIKWVPQTMGWYVLLGLLIVAAAWWGYRRFRRFRGNRYRRLALDELRAIENSLARPETRVGAIAEIPNLLKRTALSVFPRNEVAGLSGEEWFAFLDRTMGGHEFGSAEGRILSELAYAPAPLLEGLSDQSIDDLLRLVRRWIQAHAAI
jgi:LPXTG-motif cell wall-anchored protein